MTAPEKPPNAFVLDLSSLASDADRIARLVAGPPERVTRDVISWITSDPERRTAWNSACDAKREAEQAEREAEEAAAAAEKAVEEERLRPERERAAAEHRANRAAHLASIDRQPFIDALRVVELDPLHHPGRDERARLVRAVEQGQWFEARIICPNTRCRAEGTRLSQSTRDGSLVAVCGGKRRGEEVIECAHLQQIVGLIEAQVEELLADEAGGDDEEDVAPDGFDALFCDVPAEPWWGDEESGLLAASGQSLAIVGNDGTGKTTLAHQIIKGRMGLPGFDDLLDLPLRPLPEGQTVLVLALDRPEQIKAAFKRGIDSTDRAVAALLRERLVWLDAASIPDGRVLASPEGTDWLLALCLRANVGFVVVDSAKDAVDGDLSTSAVGAAYARFRRALMRDGIDVLDMLHPIKSGATTPDLSSIAGSGSLYRGIGSVIFLVGGPGDARVRLHQIKPLHEPVEPFWIEHDHRVGRSYNEDQAQAAQDFETVRALIESSGGETTSKAIVEALGIHPNAVKPRMSSLADRGWITDNGKGTSAKRWRLS